MLRKSTFKLIHTMLLLASIQFSPISLATICPETGAIISSDPNPDGTVMYLSPGWHSNPHHMVNLSETAFYLVYADQLTMSCVYDTSTGYLSLFPNNNQNINISILDYPLWYCREMQATYSPIDAEEFCVCDDSRETCSFTLQSVIPQ